MLGQLSRTALTRFLHDVPQRTVVVSSEVAPPSASTPKAIRHSELDARAVLALVQAAFWQLASCKEKIMIDTVVTTKLVAIIA